jgi:hypothetical protein
VNLKGRNKQGTRSTLKKQEITTTGDHTVIALNKNQVNGTTKPTEHVIVSVHKILTELFCEMKWQTGCTITAK